MEASKSCFASRLLPYNRSRRSSHTRDREVRSQALAQEQAVFERKMDDHGALFKLQMAMGWATFLLVPVTIVATLIYPPAAAGLVPLTGIAAWNWRRMLKRDSAEIEVMTKPPNQPK